VVRLTRLLGFLLMAAGGVVLLGWMIRPLRFLWPWIRGSPLPVRVGVGVAAVGLLVLLGSLIWERIRDREADRALREE